MLFKAIVKAGATLGVGLIPLAPGTWGSLLAAVVWWVLLPLSLFEQGALIFLALFLGMSATLFTKLGISAMIPKKWLSMSWWECGSPYGVSPQS
jgi:hypothetical protein